MTLDNSGRAVLRALGGWSIADLLLDPDTGAKRLRESCWGGTGLGGFSDGSGFQCEKRGIVVTHDDVPADAHDADGFITAEGMTRIVITEVVVVTWKQIAQYAWAMPTEVRRQLRAARDEHHAANFEWVAPRFSVRYPRRDLTPPQRLAQRDALYRYRIASARLEEALAVALADEIVVGVPEQLDMFASAS